MEYWTLIFSFFENLNWNAISAIATAAAVLVAFLAINIEKRRNQEEVKCNEAKDCLRLAYESFMKDSVDGIPSPNRLNWLMAARFITQFEMIQSQLKLSEYLAVLERQRLIWLVAFSEALEGINCVVDMEGKRHMITIPDYFYTNGRSLELKAVSVVLKFSLWGPDIKDPLDKVENAEDVIEFIGSGYPSFAAFAVKECAPKD